MPRPSCTSGAAGSGFDSRRAIRRADQTTAAASTTSSAAAVPGAPKMLEAAELAAQKERVYEVHPEVSFCAMNGKEHLPWPKKLVPHEVPDDVGTTGCGWPAATHVEIDPASPSGYYEIVVRTDVGAWHEAVGYFVVRATNADPARPVRLTRNAYNDFGGANLLVA